MKEVPYADMRAASALFVTALLFARYARSR